MIVVTGGAGFIGSNIVKELNRRGREDILVVDELKEGDSFKNLLGLHFADYLSKDDFIESLADFDDSIDAIFHEGACSDTMEYDVGFMMRTNYDYSKTLLHFAQEEEIPFIYASSAATYGTGKNGFTEEDRCEEALNPYAASKLLFDRYVRKILPHANSQIVGLRYFNVYGFQEHHKGKMASIAYQLYQQIKESDRAYLFKGTDGIPDGEQKRDFIFVKDVVEVNLWFLEQKGASGIYNCGTGQAHSFNEVARAVINAVGHGQIVYKEFPKILKGKYQNFTQANQSKLLAAGYDRGFHDLNAAVKEYCDFLQAGGYFSYVD